MDVRVARTSRLGLRALIGDAGASFHRMNTWKASKDPEYQVKQARVEHLYAIAGGELAPSTSCPTTPGYVR